jgi:F-type H+-transporting ATPase subunit delta
VTLKSIARRYAAALFEVATKAGTLDQTGRELAGIAAAIAGHDDLRHVLASPAVPAERKKAAIDALMKAGRVSGDVRRLFEMLAERERLMLVPDVAAAFEATLLGARRVVRAEVVTAVPLEEKSRAALAQALGRAAGAEVTVTARTDGSILGGVVATVGSVVYDGSVTGQLDRLRQKLVADA